MILVEMKLLSLNENHTLKHHASIAVHVETIDEGWLVSTARALLSVDPSADLGVDVYIDGSIREFFPVSAL